MAAALAALALIACALAPSARAETVTFGSGHLDWGVKQTFRNYIENGAAHGTIDVFSGATRNEDGTFRFPIYAGTYDSDLGSAEIHANGSVRFVGHDQGDGSGPELEMTISDPVLVTAGDDSVLRADVVAKPKSGETGPVTYPDVELAWLDPAGLLPAVAPGPPPGIAFGPAGATLTSAGAPAFARYPAGEVLDPVSALALLGAEGSEPPDEPAPPLPSSGKPQPTAVPTTAADPGQTTSVHKPKAKRCKRGFRKVKAKGKTRCVRKRARKQRKNAKRKAAKRKAAKRYAR